MYRQPPRNRIPYDDPKHIKPRKHIDRHRQLDGITTPPIPHSPSRERSTAVPSPEQSSWLTSGFNTGDENAAAKCPPRDKRCQARGQFCGARQPITVTFDLSYLSAGFAPSIPSPPTTGPPFAKTHPAFRERKPYAKSACLIVDACLHRNRFDGHDWLRSNGQRRIQDHRPLRQITRIPATRRRRKSNTPTTR